MTFQQFFQIKENQRPRNSNIRRGHMQNIFFLPTFDGSSKITAKAWMEKLDDFFQRHPVAEAEAIQIVVLHLEGELKDWWFDR